MDPTIADVLTAIADLRTELDQRFGAVADRVDELRLNLATHRTTTEQMFTQVDGAMRTELAVVRSNVAAVEDGIADTHAMLDGVTTEQASMRQVVDGLIVDVTDRLTRVETKTDAIKTSVESNPLGDSRT